MLRTALRNVFAHKARLLMTMLAVLLGVAFVSGTLVFTSTISNAFQKSSEKGYSHVDVSIKQDDKGAPQGRGSVSPLSQRTLEKASALPGAKSATGVVSASPRSPTRTASSSVTASPPRAPTTTAAPPTRAPIPATR